MEKSWKGHFDALLKTYAPYIFAVALAQLSMSKYFLIRGYSTSDVWNPIFAAVSQLWGSMTFLYTLILGTTLEIDPILS
jgi:hypothetical protein